MLSAELPSEPTPHPSLLATADDEQSTRRLLQARAALRSAEWSVAERLYLAALLDAPDELEALEGLGLAALQTDRPVQALEWFRRALGCAPSRSPANIRLEWSGAGR